MDNAARKVSSRVTAPAGTDVARKIAITVTQIVRGVNEERIKSLLSGRLTFDAPLASSPLKYKFAFTTEFVKHWHLCIEQRLANKIVASNGPDAGYAYSSVRRTPYGDKPAAIT